MNRLVVITIACVALVAWECEPGKPAASKTIVKADPFTVTVDSVGPATWQYTIEIPSALQQDPLAKLLHIEMISNTENHCGMSIATTPYKGGWVKDTSAKTLVYTNTVSGTAHAVVRVSCDAQNSTIFFRIKGSRDSIGANVEERILGPVPGPGH